MADTGSFVANALTSLGAVDQDGTGKMYVDGSAVNVAMSQVVAETIYIKSIFRDGQSVTGKYVTGVPQNGAVRVLLDSPLPFSSRTLQYGGRTGTTGNNGVINKNAPQMPANQDFMVYMNQVNDQMMIFPDVQKELIPLDLMKNRIAQYSSRVQMDRDASTLAEILAYSIWRALNGADNINTIDYSEEYFINTLMNNLNTKLDNGDIVSSVFSFAQNGRTVIARPKLANQYFSNNSGVILTGSNLAQEMLNNYTLDGSLNDKDFVGENYKGNVMGFNIVSCPDYIWTLAEQYLGLQAGAFSTIDGIAVSYECTATATNVDLGIKITDANETRGLLAQPLNIWGHEAFRLTQLIGTTALTTTALGNLGFTADTRKYPVAPQDLENASKITVPIFSEAGAIIGYQTVASVPTPNGGGISANPTQVVTPVITATTKTAVTIATTTTGATIYYTTNGKTPTVTTGTKYTTSFNGTGLTVKAIAVKEGMANSAVATTTVAN